MDCLSFVMCPLLAQLIIGFVFFLLQLFTELMKQTREAVHTVKQFIFLDVYGHRAKGEQTCSCFWAQLKFANFYINQQKLLPVVNGI